MRSAGGPAVVAGDTAGLVKEETPAVRDGERGVTSRDLETRLTCLWREANPFDTAVPREVERNARWAEPELVGEAAFTDWTGDGVLRHPSWRGLRADERAEQADRE